MKEKTNIRIAKEIKYNYKFIKISLLIFFVSYLIISFLRGGYHAFYYKNIYDIESLTVCSNETYRSKCVDIENKILQYVPSKNDQEYNCIFWIKPGHWQDVYSEENSNTIKQNVKDLFSKSKKELDAKLESKKDKKIIEPEKSVWIEGENYLLDEEQFHKTLKYILYRSFGWQNLKLSILIFLATCAFLIFGRYFFIGTQKSKNWIDENAKKEL